MVDSSGSYTYQQTTPFVTSSLIAGGSASNLTEAVLVIVTSGPTLYVDLSLSFGGNQLDSVHNSSLMVTSPVQATGIGPLGASQLKSWSIRPQHAGQRSVMGSTSVR